MDYRAPRGFHLRQEQWDRFFATALAMTCSLLVMGMLHWIGVHDFLVGIFGGGLYVRIYDDFTRGT